MTEWVDVDVAPFRALSAGQCRKKRSNAAAQRTYLGWLSRARRQGEVGMPVALVQFSLALVVAVPGSEKNAKEFGLNTPKFSLGILSFHHS